MIIRNNVRRLRFEQGELRQEDVARGIGCNRQTIHMIEKSKYIPSIAIAYKLARFFNTTLDEVFYVVDEVSNNSDDKKKNDNDVQKDDSFYHFL